MIKKKICMLGSFAVGKTSLVRQYVHSIFSDRYLSTIGVKISKKECRSGNKDIMLMLWDMEGEGEFSEANMSYLRGAMGFLITADGTRADTLETAFLLRLLALDIVRVPHILLVNKADLRAQWEITDQDIARIEAQGIRVVQTSAKSGEGIERAFAELTQAMLESAEKPG